MKRNSQHGKMIRILLLCLCAMLAAGCACAEDIEIVNLGGARNLNLHYGTTLADGRILLVGAANDPGKIECLPTLLCLNRDRTVSWEFTDEAFGSGEFSYTSEMSDGTIAAVYTRWGADNFACAQGIRFFTPEGKPTGKETIISETGSVPVMFTAKSRLLVAVIQGDNIGDIIGWRMIDMDGNEIKGVDNSFDYNYGFNAIDDGDSFVTTVNVTVKGRPMSAVMRMDSWGNLIRGTVMKSIREDPDTDHVPILRLAKTADGEYLAIQREPGHNAIGTRSALIRLNSELHTKWINTEIFEGIPDSFVDFAVSGGKTTVCFEKSDKYDFWSFQDFTKGKTLTIIVADENGMNPAKTEMRITPENVEWMKQYLRENAGEKEMTPQFWTNKLIPMDDGLWLLANFSIYEEREDPRIWGCMSTALIKIPEM